MRYHPKPHMKFQQGRWTVRGTCGTQQRPRTTVHRTLDGAIGRVHAMLSANRMVRHPGTGCPRTAAQIREKPHFRPWAGRVQQLDGSYEWETGYEIFYLLGNQSRVRRNFHSTLVEVRRHLMQIETYNARRENERQGNRAVGR